MGDRQSTIMFSLLGAMIVSYVLQGPVWYRRRWLLIALCAVLLAVNDWLGEKAALAVHCHHGRTRALFALGMVLKASATSDLRQATDGGADEGFVALARWSFVVFIFCDFYAQPDVVV